MIAEEDDEESDEDDPIHRNANVHSPLDLILVETYRAQGSR